MNNLVAAPGHGYAQRLPWIRRRNVRETLTLYAILSPVLIFLFIFSYIPMYGIVIAFQDYMPGSNFLSLAGAKWVGLKHFERFISSEYFWRLITNTVTLSGLQLICGFLAPVAFALLINEIKAGKLKKCLQTASYLPHFISMVVVASMALTLMASDGMINTLLKAFGMPTFSYNTQPGAFPWVYVIVNVWKTFGWNSIIYIATISAIDPELYEAAKMDGANRFQQMWHVTLPGIRSTMVVLFIFAIGSLLNANTEFILLMYNPAIYETSDVIGTYVYRMGIQQAQFSATAAIGLFMSVINCALVFITNSVSRRVADYSIW